MVPPPGALMLPSFPNNTLLISSMRAPSARDPAMKQGVVHAIWPVGTLRSRIIFLSIPLVTVSTFLSLPIALEKQIMMCLAYWIRSLLSIYNVFSIQSYELLWSLLHSSLGSFLRRFYIFLKAFVGNYQYAGPSWMRFLRLLGCQFQDMIPATAPNNHTLHPLKAQFIPILRDFQ